MKKKLILVIAAFVSLSAFSQDSTEKASRFKSDVAFSYLTRTDLDEMGGHLFSLAYSLSKRNHSFSIAPLFWYDRMRDAHSFKGTEFGYRFYPKVAHKRFFPFVSARMNYTYENVKWRKYDQFSTDVVFYLIDFKSSWRSLKLLGGYGFRYFFYEDIFYASSDFTLGIDFYKYKNETKVHGRPDYNNSYNSGSIFKYSTLTGLLSLGIGIKLK